MRFLWILLFSVASVVGLPLAVCAGLVILQADQDHSRFFAFAILAAYAAVLAITRAVLFGSGNPRVWATLFLLGAAGFGAASYFNSPSGRTEEENAGYEVHNTSGKAAATPRWHPCNLVAESDQAHLAISLANLVFKERAPASAARVQSGIQQIYKEIRYQANPLVNFGSSQSYTYGDWLGYPQASDHRYLYFPPKSSRAGPCPAFLLLHGEEGNLQANLWILRYVADALGMAVIAPTHGAGHWQSTSGLQRIEETVAACRKDPRFGPGALTLVALGSAGAGAGAIAQKHPQWFSGLVLIRAPLDAATVGKAEFRAAWRGRPILMIHGAKDKVIPYATAEKQAQQLLALGALTRLQRMEEADQYIALAERPALSEEIIAWVRSGGK